MVQQQKTTNILVIALIVLLGFGAGFVYHAQFSVPSSVAASPFAGKRDDLASFKDFTLKTDVLDSDTYRSLQVFGELPVSTGTPGKQNPFSQ